MKFHRQNSLLFCVLLSFSVHAGLFAAFVHAVKPSQEPIKLTTPIQVSYVQDYSEFLGNAQSDSGTIDTKNRVSENEADEDLEQSATQFDPPAPDEEQVLSAEIARLESAPVEQLIDPQKTPLQPAKSKNEPIAQETQISVAKTEDRNLTEQSFSEPQPESTPSENHTESEPSNKFTADVDQKEKFNESLQQVSTSTVTEKKLKVVQSLPELDHSVEPFTDIPTSTESFKIEEPKINPKQFAAPVNLAPHATKTGLENLDYDQTPVLPEKLQLQVIDVAISAPRQEESVEITEIKASTSSPSMSLSLEVPPEPVWDWDSMSVARTFLSEQSPDNFEPEVNLSAEPTTEAAPDPVSELAALDFDSQYVSVNDSLPEDEQYVAPKLEPSVEFLPDEKFAFDVEDADQLAGIFPRLESTEHQMSETEALSYETASEDSPVLVPETQVASFVDFDSEQVLMANPEIDSFAVNEVQNTDSFKPIDELKADSVELPEQIIALHSNINTTQLAKEDTTQPIPVERNLPAAVASSDLKLAAADQQSSQSSDDGLALPESVQTTEPQPTKNIVTSTLSVAAQPSSPQPQTTKNASQQASLSSSAFDSAPKYGVRGLPNPAPKYPRRSRANGEQGKVILQVSVNPNGDVDHVKVFESSGFSRLDKAAKKAVRKWKFQPAQENGKTISGIVWVPFSFRLEQS